MLVNGNRCPVHGFPSRLARSSMDRLSRVAALLAVALVPVANRIRKRRLS
jgi:hypothetical protein